MIRLNAALTVIEGAIPALAWSYRQAVVRDGSARAIKRFELLGVEYWRAKRCHIVRNHNLFENPIDHYIDEKTGQELYRKTIVQIDANKTAKVEVIYTYETSLVEAIVLPSGFELYVDEKLRADAHFRTIKINRGLLNYLFERPETAN